MRGRTEAERLEEEAELLLRVLLAQTHDLEDALLQVLAVDTNRATADLVAVAHHVVRVRERLAWFGVERVDVLGLRHRERVVHGRPRTGADGDVPRGDSVGGRLEQRRVDDPQEAPRVLVDEVAALADLQTRCAEQRARRLRRTRGEEDAVAGLRTDVAGEARHLGLGEVLGHRAGERAVLLDEDVREALRAALLRPLLPRVELTTGLRRTTRHDDGADVFGLEHAERRVLEELRALDELVAEAQVGLVRAVLRHRVGVRHARERRRQVDADRRPHGLRDLLTELDDVVLLDEAHLDVELRELGLTVGAEVLVAVAARDLVVAFHPGDHEQLLEQLRALRQRVPAARRETSGDEEVASALGRRTRQRRRLDLDEVALVEHGARSLAHLRAQTDRVALVLATQVEVAVLEARLLADGDALVDLERQRRRLGEHLDLVRDDVDLTCRQVRVDVLRLARGDLTRHLDAVLGAQTVRGARQHLVACDDLDDARGVTQVDEGDTAVVATLGHPTRQGDGVTDVGCAKGSGFMGSKHDVPLDSFHAATRRSDDARPGAPRGSSPGGVGGGQVAVPPHLRRKIFGLSSVTPDARSAAEHARHGRCSGGVSGRHGVPAHSR